MHSNLARTLILYVGGDYTFDLTVSDNEGTPIDLTDTTLTFQVRRRSGADLLLEKATGDGITHDPDQAGAGKGKAELAIPRADLAVLLGRYAYGLWLTDALGNRQPLREGGVLYVRAPVVAAP